MKKILSALIVAFLGLSVSAAFAATTPKIIAAQLYADWCGSCKQMDPTYNAVQNQYADDPVVFIKFDRTDEKTSQKAELLASAIGFGKGYDEYEGTGKVLLIDNNSKQVFGILNKTHSAEQMAEIIDGALAGKNMMDTAGKGSPGQKGSAKGSAKGSSY